MLSLKDKISKKRQETAKRRIIAALSVTQFSVLIGIPTGIPFLVFLFFGFLL
jgi:uncharacterized membrane protein